MPNTPLNPDDAEEATLMWRQVSEAIDHEHLDPREFLDLAKLKWLLDRILAVAQPVVNSVESLPAKMRMLAWDGGEFEIAEIPEGHVLVGFEMATDRAWSMADKVTIHIERKDTTNGR